MITYSKNKKQLVKWFKFKLDINENNQLWSKKNRAASNFKSSSSYFSYGRYFYNVVSIIIN